jgi:hypothetical protein
VRILSPSKLTRQCNTFSKCFSSLSFILAFATTLFVLTTEHTERLHLLLNQQHRLICVTHLTKMRRYDIISGILLILSIIDFALPAPVLVQEKRQERVDVVHIPKDVITVLGRRGREDELEKLWEGYFDNLVNLEESGNLESPSSHSSSSSPSEPDHGSTNVVQAPAPNPLSSTANPDPAWDFMPSYKDDYELNWPHYTPTSSGYGSDREFMKAHAPQPNHPMPSTDSDSSTNPDLDWDYLMNLEDPPPPRPASPKVFGQAHKYQAGVNRPSTSGYAPSPPEPEHEVVTNQPSPNQGSPKDPKDEVDPGSPPSPDPELHLDHQPLSADP